MKQEKVDKRCIELLKKAMGKEYDNVSEIAIRKTLELSPILQNQLELFSYNDICKWFDDVVKITAKAKDEEDKFSVKIWQIRIKELQKENEKYKKETRDIVERTKQQTVEEIFDFIENHIQNKLYNHRKEEAGLISLQNTLLNDIREELKKYKQKWCKDK